VLADLVIGLRDEGRLCVSEKEQEANEPQIICSLGLISHASGRSAGTDGPGGT
jgi:hypothetical protein